MFDSPLLNTLLKSSGIRIDADENEQIVYISQGQGVIEKTYNEFVAEVVSAFGGKIYVSALEKRP